MSFLPEAGAAGSRIVTAEVFALTTNAAMQVAASTPVPPRSDGSVVGAESATLPGTRSVLAHGGGPCPHPQRVAPVATSGLSDGLEAAADRERVVGPELTETIHQG